MIYNYVSLYFYIENVYFIVQSHIFLGTIKFKYHIYLTYTVCNKIPATQFKASTFSLSYMNTIHLGIMQLTYVIAILYGLGSGTFVTHCILYLLLSFLGTIHIFILHFKIIFTLIVFIFFYIFRIRFTFPIIAIFIAV